MPLFTSSAARPSSRSTARRDISGPTTRPRATRNTLSGFFSGNPNPSTTQTPPRSPNARRTISRSTGCSKVAWKQRFKDYYANMALVIRTVSEVFGLTLARGDEQLATISILSSGYSGIPFGPDRPPGRFRRFRAASVRLREARRCTSNGQRCFSP